MRRLCAPTLAALGATALVSLAATAAELPTIAVLPTQLDELIANQSKLTADGYQRTFVSSFDGADGEKRYMATWTKPAGAGSAPAPQLRYEERGCAAGGRPGWALAILAGLARRRRARARPR